MKHQEKGLKSDETPGERIKVWWNTSVLWIEYGAIKNIFCIHMIVTESIKWIDIIYSNTINSGSLFPPRSF